MTPLLKLIVSLLVTGMLLQGKPLMAQAAKAKPRIVVDIAHGQKFWNDPADMVGKEPALIDRIKYMTGELTKNAMALHAQVGFQKTKLTPEALAKCAVLFIHIPSARYEAGEIQAIHQYLRKGGSLFVVMEQDYWSTLA